MLSTVIYSGVSVFLLAGILFYLLRINAFMWVFLALGLLPTLLPFVVTPQLRVYGYHEWLQAGMVYQILGGNIPPYNPLLAGTKVLYPWAYPFVIALVSKALNITPFYSAALISMLVLIAVLVITFKIARFLSDNKAVCIFSTLASLYAFTFTQDAYLDVFNRWLGKFLPIGMRFAEGRAMPIVEKFNGCTGFHLGILFYALALLFMLKIIASGKVKRSHAAGLLCAILGVGFFYPFMLPGAAISSFLICIIAGFSAEMDARRTVIVVSGILLLCLAILGAYLYPLSALKHSAAQIGFSLSYKHFFDNGGVLLMTILPMLIIIAVCHKVLFELFRQRKAAFLAIVAGILTNAFLFLCIEAPMRTEYKFLALTVYGMGFFGGVCFWQIYVRSRYLCFVLVALFLMPTALDSGHKIMEWREFPLNYVERGVYIFPLDKEEAEFYDWVRHETARDDVFIDSTLSLPVYAQRSLYIGFDSDKKEKGYSETAKVLLEAIQGYGSKLIAARRKTVAELLYGENAVTRDTIAPINHLNPNASVYIVLREQQQRPKYIDNPLFSTAFENRGFLVVKVRK